MSFFYSCTSKKCTFLNLCDSLNVPVSTEVRDHYSVQSYFGDLLP